jgi:hypothetical protein
MVKGKLLQKNSDPGKLWAAEELDVARSEMTQRANVARCRGHDRKRYDQDSVVQETQKGRTFVKRRWKSPECNKWHKGLRPNTADTRQQANKRPRQPTAAMTEEGQHNHERHRRVELRIVIAPGKRRKAQHDPI